MIFPLQNTGNFHTLCFLGTDEDGWYYWLCMECGYEHAHKHHHPRRIIHPAPCGVYHIGGTALDKDTPPNGLNFGMEDINESNTGGSD